METTQTTQTPQMEQQYVPSVENMFIAFADGNVSKFCASTESEQDLLWVLRLASEQKLHLRIMLYDPQCADRVLGDNFLALEQKYANTEHKVFFEKIKLYLNDTTQMTNFIPDALNPKFDCDTVIKNILNLRPITMTPLADFLYAHAVMTVTCKREKTRIKNQKNRYAKLFVWGLTQEDINIAKKVEDASRKYFSNDEKYISFTSITDEDIKEAKLEIKKVDEEDIIKSYMFNCKKNHDEAIEKMKKIGSDNEKILLLNAAFDEFQKTLKTLF